MASSCLDRACMYGPALLCLSLKLEVIEIEMNTTELTCEQQEFKCVCGWKGLSSAVWGPHEDI